MNGTLIGLLAVLALVGAFGGVVAFFIVLVIGAVDLLVGRSWQRCAAGMDET